METIYDSKDTRTIGSVSSLPVDSVPSITASGTPSAAANVLTVIGSSTTGNVVQFSNAAGVNFIMTNAGRIGIGTTAPSQKLHVTGNVYVQATTVNVGPATIKYVAVAESSSIATSSTDGIFWTQRTLPTSSNWSAVTWNSTTGIFATVANGSTAAASSTDGINWVARTLPSSSGWCVATVNPNTGIFVTLAANQTAAASSTDGFNWVARTVPDTSQWRAITVNPTTGVFVAVGGHAQSGVPSTSSTDGFNWVTRSIPSVQNSSQWTAVTVNPTTGIFVALAYFSSIGAYSADGITWTTMTLPSQVNWYSVTFGQNLYVAVAYSSSTAASSTDGINWTARTMPSSLAWYSVTYNSVTNVFVAVAYGSSTAASSTNGTTWTAQSLSSSSNWVSVTSSYQVTNLTNGFTGLGVAVPSYQLDLSTDGARKLTTTTWLTGSDSRIKTDVESANLQTCYETVKSLDLKYFKWNFPAGIVPDDKHSLGFIAQEVKSVFPNAVSASNSYGYSDFLSLNVDQIKKALFGAVKHLAAKVEALEQSQAP